MILTLSFERVYRSIVNRTSLNCGREVQLKNDSFWKKQNKTKQNKTKKKPLSIRIVVSSVLCLHLTGTMSRVFLRLKTSPAYFKVLLCSLQEQRKFKSYVELHHSGKNCSSQEQKVLETFSTRLSSQSLAQRQLQDKADP